MATAATYEDIVYKVRGRTAWIIINRPKVHNDEGAFKVAMSRAAAALELSCFAYLCLPHRRSDKARLISTYPRPWTDHYLNNHYERLDPVIRRALQVTKPFEWGAGIESGKLSDIQRQLFEDAATFGIRYGFTIPMRQLRRVP
jgi:hypothetical protein